MIGCECDSSDFNGKPYTEEEAMTEMRKTIFINAIFQSWRLLVAISFYQLES